MKRFPSTGRLAASILGVAALAATVSACAPLMVGGAAMTGAVVATDRRSSGAQLDDQGIELRAANRLREQMGSRARISVTSYNRRVLLTGEVANARDKALAEEIVSQVDNVQGLVNELSITASPTLTQQANDTLTTGKVKAGLFQRLLQHSRVPQVASLGPQAVEQCPQQCLEALRCLQLCADYSAHQHQGIERKPRRQPERYTVAGSEAPQVGEHVAPLGRDHRR